MTASVDIEWWFSKNIMKKGYEVQGYIKAQQGKIAVMQPPLFHTMDISEVDGFASAPMTLTKESVQRMMDQLWECGVRPSNGAGNVGELAAVKEHLKDMRDIAFSFIELKK